MLVIPAKAGMHGLLQKPAWGEDRVARTRGGVRISRRRGGENSHPTTGWGITLRAFSITGPTFACGRWRAW